MKIGQPISIEEQEKFADIEKYGRYLRANTFTLANTLKVKDFFEKEKTIKQQEIIPAIKKEILSAEIAGIPDL